MTDIQGIDTEYHPKKSYMDDIIDYKNEKWEKWKRENPQIIDAVDKYFEKLHELEGCYGHILRRKA